MGGAPGLCRRFTTVEMGLHRHPSAMKLRMSGAPGQYRWLGALASSCWRDWGDDRCGQADELGD